MRIKSPENNQKMYSWFWSISWYYLLTESITRYEHAESRQTNLSLKPLQRELFLHLVLDPGICTVLSFQQGRPAVTCLSVCLHQNYSNQTIVLYWGKINVVSTGNNYFVHKDYLSMLSLPSVHVASSDTVLSYNFPLKRQKKCMNLSTR